jgi:hypothetical protein
MIRMPPLAPLLGIVLLTTAATARADNIYLRNSKDKDKPSFSGAKVVQESPLGIKLAGVKNDIAADEIRDIIYDVKPVGVQVNIYNPGDRKEKAALLAKDPQERAKMYKEAIQFYEDTLMKMDAEQPFPRRHLEFKIAMARWHIAQALGQPDLFKQAFAALADFRKKHPQSWQIGPCLTMVAQWHLERKEWADAEKVLFELARSSVAENIRFDAELAALETLARQGKHQDAKLQLEVLAEKEPKGTPKNLRLRIALVECLGYAKKVTEARKIMDAVLDEAKKDKTLHAQAHNAMGVCYVLNDLWREASWEFLWVDLIYNQDKTQHAKALYYLSTVFDKLGERDRAREWRNTLDANMYLGTLYQRWAKE